MNEGIDVIIACEPCNESIYESMSELVHGQGKSIRAASEVLEKSTDYSAEKIRNRFRRMDKKAASGSPDPQGKFDLPEGTCAPQRKRKRKPNLKLIMKKKYDTCREVLEREYAACKDSELKGHLLEVLDYMDLKR